MMNQNKLYLELKIGETFTKEKSDKLMAYLNWFINGIKTKQREEIIEIIEGIMDKHNFDIEYLEKFTKLKRNWREEREEFIKERIKLNSSRHNH